MSPSQGNPGAGAQSTQYPNHGSGGGGGKPAARGSAGGASGTGGGPAGPGGSGTASSITGSPVTYAEAAVAARWDLDEAADPADLAAGGNGGSSNPPSTPNGGTDGLGGGSGGAGNGPDFTLNGGNGIVIIRRLTSSSDTDSGTVTTDGSDTIHTFNASGTYTG